MKEFDLEVKMNHLTGTKKHHVTVLAKKRESSVLKEAAAAKLGVEAKEITTLKIL